MDNTKSEGITSDSIYDGLSYVNTQSRNYKYIISQIATLYKDKKENIDDISRILATKYIIIDNNTYPVKDPLLNVNDIDIMKLCLEVTSGLAKLYIDIVKIIRSDKNDSEKLNLILQCLV